MAGKINKTSYSVPGGSNTQLQYSDAGLFGGCAQLYWNKTTNCMGLGGTPTSGKLTIKFDVGETPIFEVATADTNVARSVHILKHKTTGNMVDGLGINFLFRLEDATSGTNTIAQIKAIRDGADNEGRLSFQAGTGGSEEFITARSSGKVGIGVTTPAKELTVGPITKQNTCRINGVSTANMAPVLSLFRHAGAEWVVTVHGDKLLIGTDPASYTDANLSSSAKFAIDVIGHVGLGTISPVTSALLELSSTTGALLLSRMTTTQKNALTPVNGMIVYDSTLGKFQKREGGTWIGDGVVGNDTEVQFNDAGSLGSDTGLVFDKTKNMLTVGVPWGTGYPFDSFEATVEGISEAGEWGVLGASRSSDYGSTGSMKCLGLYGFVQNDSNTGAYGLYVEARKTVSIPSAATLGAEIVILNRYNSQVDVTPTSNPAQSTYGLSLTSGVTYDGIQDYDASVGLYFGHVGAKFRRGIVMSNAALRSLSGKYIAMLLPNSARICWVNDNNCIMGNATDIDVLIGNSLVTQVTSAGLGVVGIIVATTKVQGGNVYMQNNALHLDVNDVVVSAGSNSMYFATGGTTQAILYTTTGNLSIGGSLAENQWTLDIEEGNRKWQLLDSIVSAYKAHDGKKLDPALQVKTNFGNRTKNGRRPSDFIQVTVECVADLHKRIEVLENG